jgi:Mce-associated membrane protein
MEGDAGTSRLNPIGNDPDTDEPQTTADAVTLEKSTPLENSASDVAAASDEQPGEGDDESVGGEPATDDPVASARRAERLGRGWFAAIVLGLLVLTAGLGVGGYFALRQEHANAAMARDDDVAIARAKECVTATQAPDLAAMTASQTKIIECGTGDFAVQASLFSSILVEAYQAANVQIQVSDMRAAVEHHNDDGSVDVLVALRTKVTNTAAADREQGYRLRVRMAPADGTYKVAKLDQVTS